MKTNYIPFASQKSSEWSGGTTTELFIYPRWADYQKRDFLFRLSSATVDDTFSVFTKLEGYQRTLIVLNGSLRLVHKNIRETALGRYDSDRFSGGWETTGYGGGVTDFNLMVKEGCEADVKLIKISADGCSKINITDNARLIIGVYSVSGPARVACGNVDQALADKDFFAVEKEPEEAPELEVCSLPGRPFVLSVMRPPD